MGADVQGDCVHAGLPVLGSLLAWSAGRNSQEGGHFSMELAKQACSDIKVKESSLVAEYFFWRDGLGMEERQSELDRFKILSH